MRIFAVTPIHVPEDELRRRQARYDALCPSGIRVDLRDIGVAAPTALDTDQQVRDSAGLVRAALETAPDDADALLPDCVLDPGVSALAGRLERPVFGLLRSTIAWQRAAGRQVAAVTRNAAIATEFGRVAAEYGYADCLTTVEVLDLDVAAIADSARWAEALAAAASRLGSLGAAAVVNGCSAVDLPAQRRAAVPLIDPTALTLRLIAAGEAA
ncbi:MAG: aspartate/glutamate racemase family protein [Actinomycetota bacterium]|nr:aspartate/glutamate racemase family protein [Actinomycetota bacterium]